MKKKLILIGFIGFTVLFGCSQVSQDVEANIPNGYREVTKSYINENDIIEIQHIKTGCHYTLIDGYNSGGLTQMFIENNGVSVPYCEK